MVDEYIDLQVKWMLFWYFLPALIVEQHTQSNICKQD
jgi:hypothetical protein